MKILTIVGARPQFIKAAALSNKLREHHSEILLHTGQHFDSNMSQIFFSELSIPQPDYNLGISGGTHGKMTGEMLSAIEQVLLSEKPDMVVVYGDTNSTLSGALAAVKLNIPICHIEAGARTHSLRNPEEVNRILTDRISSLLLCCTEVNAVALAAEGTTKNVFVTGDLMLDVFLHYRGNLKSPEYLPDYSGNQILLPEEFYLLTCHREENTTDISRLHEILWAMNELEAPTVYPVHPRCFELASHLCEKFSLSNIILLQPVSYLISQFLIATAKKVVTDSGGLQREAWFYGKQCVTVFDYVVWPETLEGSINQMAEANHQDILSKLSVVPDFSKRGNQFGDGDAAQKITSLITGFF